MTYRLAPFVSSPRWRRRSLWTLFRPSRPLPCGRVSNSDSAERFGLSCRPDEVVYATAPRSAQHLFWACFEGFRASQRFRMLREKGKNSRKLPPFRPHPLWKQIRCARMVGSRHTRAEIVTAGGFPPVGFPWAACDERSRHHARANPPGKRVSGMACAQTRLRSRSAHARIFDRDPIRKAFVASAEAAEVESCKSSDSRGRPS